MLKKIKGGLLILIGYLLSPFSWWNDAFINIPIAYLFGFLFSLISPKLFLPITIIFYWLTNIFGIILIYLGTYKIFLNKESYSKKNLILGLIFATIYTLVIIFLAVFLKFPKGIKN